LNPSEQEKAWDVWNKQGLEAICKEEFIHLVVTSKSAIIKVLVDRGVAFRAPPKPLTPPRAAQKQHR
jgi:hypothetical protein